MKTRSLVQECNKHCRSIPSERFVDSIMTLNVVINERKNWTKTNQTKAQSKNSVVDDYIFIDVAVVLASLIRVTMENNVN